MAKRAAPRKRRTPKRSQTTGKFKVLKESIEHHIEEEERRMFPVARAVLGRTELKELGRRMKALKATLED